MSTNIEISRAVDADLVGAELLFEQAIGYAARGDGFDPEETPWVAEGRARSIELMRGDVVEGDPATHFLVARDGGRVVAAIGRTRPSAIITEALPVDPDRVPELVCLAVLPEYHRHGLGSRLFEALLASLRADRVQEYVLDCGYRSSRGFWLGRLGDPKVHLRDYWGDGYDHMIWHRRLDLSG